MKSRMILHHLKLLRSKQGIIFKMDKLGRARIIKSKVGSSLLWQIIWPLINNNQEMVMEMVANYLHRKQINYKLCIRKKRMIMNTIKMILKTTQTMNSLNLLFLSKNLRKSLQTYNKSLLCLEWMNKLQKSIILVHHHRVNKLGISTIRVLLDHLILTLSTNSKE